MLKSLEKMETEWDGLEFKVLSYKDSGVWGGRLGRVGGWWRWCRLAGEQKHS